MNLGSIPAKLDKKYQVEHWVRSNLHSHNAKPFSFTFTHTEVTLFPPRSGEEPGGFIASTILTSSSLVEAEITAHDVLTRVLDLLAFEMKVFAVIERSVRSQAEGSGTVRQCAIYLHERRERPLFLMDNQAAEVQNLLNTDVPVDVERALYWLRWSYRATTVPEKFLFIWMAIERLAGEEERIATCRICQEQVICPSHGSHKYVTVSRNSIKALLKRHKVTLPETVLQVRNPLVHGSLKYRFETRVVMSEASQKLRIVVEQELQTRLKTTKALKVTPPSPNQSIQTCAHCQYDTSYTEELFPRDCPTPEETREYMELSGRGGQNPKNIVILEWPPAW